MRTGPPFPVRDAEAKAMPEPDEHIVFCLLAAEKAAQESRLDDAVRGLGQCVSLAGNRSQELTDDESRLLSRVTTEIARAVQGVW